MKKWASISLAWQPAILRHGVQDGSQQPIQPLRAASYELAVSTNIELRISQPKPASKPLYYLYRMVSRALFLPPEKSNPDLTLDGI